ncbi:hypothetical protein [Algibacillus agarilyticus]|uniref:hypothetical protein n=1 Tax=Algibacillus agarilyticus TaxID=2234133 RepID=UPI000DCF6662|nr:hypothetical protein [Algibacillus agarilyticus]
MNCDFQKIIRITQALNDFWLNSRGWAPESAYALIKEARLDRQLSFAKTLPEYEEVFLEEVKDAKIILGYATLRSMSESAIKLFFSAFIEDYLKDSEALKKNKKIVQPKKISFDNLISLYIKKGEPSFESYLRRVQSRGNAIHHFNDRDIGFQSELIEDINTFKDLLLAINSQLPYPDGVQNPENA